MSHDMRDAMMDQGFQAVGQAVDEDELSDDLCNNDESRGASGRLRCATAAGHMSEYIMSPVKLSLHQAARLVLQIWTILAKGG